MASAPLTHLHPSARAEAMLDEQARLHVLQRDRWVDYPRANQARVKLEQLLLTPKRERMPCMVMHGESNIGKTLIVRKFQREHPATFDTAAEVERRPIIAMQRPATPDQHRFYSALLFELGALHSASASLSVLEHLARELLRRIAPRMLIVDEVHHLLAGGYREQRASLNLLKFLANDLKISVVVVGTTDAPLALASDMQMRSRFTPFEIPRWRESVGVAQPARRFRASSATEKAVRVGPTFCCAVRPVRKHRRHRRDLPLAQRCRCARDSGRLRTRHVGAPRARRK